MSFASRITRQPIAFDPAVGDDTLSILPAFRPEENALIKGVAGCSPYLKTLLEKEKDWLSEAFADPDQALDDLLAALSEVDAVALPVALRQAKRRVALLAGLADCGGVWSLEQVTGALTSLADRAVHLALRACVGAEIKRGKLPGATPEDAETAGGMVALAMGKMGAGELNYSSDIDLICLFDESRFDRSDFMEARSSFVRATRKMSAMLNDLTGDGYVFRTDLRLRPDPAVTPVCIAMAAAETYYESLGRTWERAAYVKARPSGGDLAAGDRFLKQLTPFVWRKHLDFAAIQDAHDMRLRIREHKGLGGDLNLAGHNMKLGRGGIREIEFFAQTRQLIAGGRDPDLRVRGTVAALQALTQKGWVEEAVSTALIDHYRFHRDVEHRLQMTRDAQTHSLPNSPEGMQRLACFLGRDTDSLKEELRGRLEQVHGLTEGFFAPEGRVAPVATVDAPESPIDPELLKRWRSYPAFRSSRAVEIFERIKPRLFERLAAATNPEEAAVALDGFFKGLPAGVQLLSLFESNPQLIDLLVDIAGSSPELATYLSRHSSVFDAVIGGDFFADWPGKAALQGQLADQFESETDYERKLDLARRWAKEWHFRVGVHGLRGLITAEDASVHYADLAEAVVTALWPVVVAEFARKHGDCPGRGAMVLGMGSLGAGRLHSRSDLDLIVVYDANGVEASNGRRPLAARAYYARLTQALVTSISALMSEGRLYEVDMRLRPSGTQGPVATSLTSFRNYQLTEAWTWEHLALTRARAIAGDPYVIADVMAVRAEVMGGSFDLRKVFADVAEMRGRISAAKSGSGVFEAKLGPGRAQDIELLAQACALTGGDADPQAGAIESALSAAARRGLLSDPEAEDLITSYRLCWSLRLVSKLLTDKDLNPDRIGHGGTAMLLRETQQASIAALQETLSAQTDRAAQRIDTVLQRITQG